MLLRVVLPLIMLFHLMSNASAADENVYTAYNMWFENPSSMYCINFKTGEIIPAGTQVEGARLVKALESSSSISPEQDKITFTRASDRKVFEVSFDSRYHPGKTVKDYFQNMFTTLSFEQITSSMTQQEVYAIRRGILVPNMSKEAVLVSYGPPPEHYTKALENDLWYYWTQRNLRKEVYFDEQGRTLCAL